MHALEAVGPNLSLVYKFARKWMERVNLFCGSPKHGIGGGGGVLPSTLRPKYFFTVSRTVVWSPSMPFDGHERSKEHTSVAQK